MLLTLTGDAAIFFKRNQVNYLKWDYVGENNDIIFLNSPDSPLCTHQSITLRAEDKKRNP